MHGFAQFDSQTCLGRLYLFGSQFLSRLPSYYTPYFFKDNHAVEKPIGDDSG